MSKTRKLVFLLTLDGTVCIILIFILLCFYFNEIATVLPDAEKIPRCLKNEIKKKIADLYA